MRLLLFTTCFALASLVGVGQKSRFSVGLKAGIGISGTTRKEVLENNPPQSVLTDRYSQRLSYAAGLRAGYRLNRRFAIALDIEGQFLRDDRIRQLEFIAKGGERTLNVNLYNNEFYRLQFPVTLRYDVWQGKKSALYWRGGFQYARLLKAHTERGVAFRSSPPFTGDVPLDIPANRPIRSSLQPVAGLGWQFNRTLALELTGQFGRKLRYDLFDPGATFVLPPTDFSWAARSVLLNVVVSFGKP